MKIIKVISSADDINYFQKDKKSYKNDILKFIIRIPVILHYQLNYHTESEIFSVIIRINRNID